jgi:hypothetical protein
MVCASWPSNRRLAVRGGAQNRGATEEEAEGRGLFETGYGPSGLPHIGTFGEVARTSMVRHAFRVLTDDKIRPGCSLLRRHGRPAQGAGQRAEQGDAGAASRQAADQGARPVRHPSELRRAQQRPAARLPRPASASTTSSSRARPTTTRSGRFDARCSQMLAAYRQGDGDHAAVAARGARATYSPFLPIHPTTGIVLQVPILTAHDVEAGTIVYATPTPQRASPRRSPAAAASCSGSRTGRCAGRARRRLRDGRQGPDRFGQASRGEICTRARRHAAGGLQLRALPRREGPEDLEVEGQWPHHRRVAALRLAGEPVAVHVSRSRRRRSGCIST